MELGYFEVGGRAQGLRMLLHCLKADYKNRFFKNDEEVLAAFQVLRPDFGGMPYLKDQDFVMSDVKTIAQYVSAKMGRPEMMGKSGVDRAKHLELLGVLSDLEEMLFKVISAQGEHRQLYDSLEAVINYKVAKLGRFLGDKGFLLGYFTFADIETFCFLEILDRATRRLGKGSLFDREKNLKAHADRVRSLEGVRDFLESGLGRLLTMPGYMNSLGV